MKYKELQTKSEAEINQLLLELRQQAHDMAVKIRLSQHKNTSQLKFLKKDIARILTYLHQKVSSK